MNTRAIFAIIRKDLLDEIYKTCQFEFSEHFLMTDIQMWIEIAYRSKVKYIDEPLSEHRLLPESASQSKDVDKRIRFSKNHTEIRLHYANKYGGSESKEIRDYIIKQTN